MSIFWKKILVTCFLLVACFVLVPNIWAASSSYGLQEAQQATGGTVIGNSNTNVPQLVGKIINIGLGFIGIIFFLLILYSGILWMVAGGTADKVDKAKDIMIAAVIGLVIVLAAYAITNFVITSLGV